MATMNISLPEELRAYVEDQVGSGLYANSSDFVRAAIREHRDSLARLDQLIQDGMDSGWSARGFDEIIADARERARSRAA